MNVVIDLETLSLKPSAVILSIGAAAENGEVFYRELDWKAQTFRRVDPGTCMWWGQQDKTLCPLEGETLLPDALMDLSEWLVDWDKDNLFVWARGPQFDIVVLEDAFAECCIEVPWKYKNVRDIRTALALSSNTTLFDPVRKHHALEDAVADMKNLAVRGFTVYDYKG